MSEPPPHHRNRRKPSGHRKRRQVALENGWTVVVGAKPSIPTEIRRLTEKGQAHLDGMFAYHPEPIEPGLTAAKLGIELQSMRQKWKDTACRTKVKALVKDRLDQIVPVTHAVCLGLGSFSDSRDGRKSSLWQLLLFLEVVDYLHNQGNAPISLTAQDPGFNTVDEEFLQSQGCSILKTPAAFELISSSTFVYAPFLPWGILAIDIFPLGFPALYIGTEIDDIVDAIATTFGAEYFEKDKEAYGRPQEAWEEASRGMQRTLSTVNGVKLPDFEFDMHSFHELALYTRNPAG